MLTKPLLLLLLATVAPTSQNCDKYGVLLYDDIGCSPSTASPCPTEYFCNLTRPENGCTFKGQPLYPGQDIGADLTYSGCEIGCKCEDFNFIRCATLDCPEETFEEDECYNVYELGRCCATGQKCNSTETCVVDGTEYKLGQKFYPKNECLTCVCHEDFNGEFDEKTCQKSNCNVQVRFTEELTKKCAPAYFNFHSEEALCCPDTFVCPDKEDFIKVVNFEAETDSGLTCDFGVEKLKLGEGFSRMVNGYGKDRSLGCECVMPPLVTCKEVY
ncbi:uncharacterized protein LOC126737252 [Anthonomus grandis grandis]|uniref:uncharacterized protein LOC126737252 n=1 Tax=Anthonomus grandis grandis TaxID=2921223 RepID=UPI002166A346|nr:uncharacterized protein LOC126737252 [Anthonomus grandis grandis]